MRIGTRRHGGEISKCTRVAAQKNRRHGGEFSFRAAESNLEGYNSKAIINLELGLPGTLQSNPVRVWCWRH